MFKEYTRVVLLSNKYTDRNATAGMIGYIIECYPDGNYEVEFSDPRTGISIAQIVAAESELAESPEPGAS
jgi:hypothetical protein